MRTISLIFLISIIFSSISCKKYKKKNPSRPAETAVQTKSLYTIPFDFCDDGNPVGGGSGYQDYILQSQANIVVSTNLSASSFRTLVESSPSLTIYLMPNVEINLSGITSPIVIPEGTTIASNRGSGTSPGAKIYSTLSCPYGSSCSYSNTIFVSGGGNIRLTGLRFTGPTTDIGTSSRDMLLLLMKGYDHLEVDNCELKGWSYAAIAIGSAGYANRSDHSNRIHHNYIGYNRRFGLGYGVAVNNGFTQIYANEFDHNRHDIACSGARNSDNTGYEAYCNIVLSGGNEANFDVHGEDSNTKPNASTFFYIHHNMFLDKGESRSDNKQNILLIGRPDNQCRIEHNIFYHSGPIDAIDQQNSFGNLLAFNNVYDYGNPGGYLGWYVKPTWIKKNVSNFVNLPSSNTTILSKIGNQAIIDYALGDANGDSKTDIYKIENGILSYLPYQISGGLTQQWQQLGTTTYLINQLQFGHFNSDNITDMIVKDGNNIYVSWGCTAPWTVLITTSYNFSIFKVGDMLGSDGIDDLFFAANGEWRCVNMANPGAGSTWLINRNENSNVLALGWFDLNPSSKIDVFHANGVSFYSAYDGNAPSWTTLGSSTYTMPYLTFGDFNSDGITDVINNVNPRQVSLSGRQSWANCTVNNFPLSAFQYIDY